MSGIMQMIASHRVPSITVSGVTYANIVFNLDAAGYGALPGNAITTSASFDGSTQYLTVPHNSGLDLSASTAWTIEGWVYWSGANSQANFIEKDGVSGVRTPSYGIQMDGSGNVRASVSDGTTEQTITSTTALTANTWTHIAFTLNSGSIYLYQGGTRANFAALSQTIVDGGGNVFIGYQQGQASTYYLGGRLSYIRLNANTAVYTANFVPSTSTLRPIPGTQLLLPLVATPFMDISTNESTITNIGTVTTTASAPSLTAITTDLTGTYAMTRTGASISWKSTATGGYFEKNNTTGTDHITGGPNYAISQSYTVFMAYQGDSRSGGRLLNTASEAVSDWVAGTYASGTLYKNVFYPNGTVNLNSDSYVGNSGWNFLWALYNTSTGWGNLYIAASGVNSTVGPTAAYKFVNVGTGSTHGFNQFRLWSRSVGAEVQTGNIGLVRVYDGVMPLEQIQSTWANLHTRFGI